METNSYCSICQEEFSKIWISYSCGHKYCFNCSPYIIYDIIQLEGIKKEFFIEEEQNEYLCIICKKGTGKILFDVISEFMTIKANLKNETDFVDKKTQLCNACEQQIPSKWCEECNIYYCYICEDFFHNKNIAFKSHSIMTLFEKNKKIKKDSEVFNQHCICIAKPLLEYFCIDCTTSICRFCSKFDHENHKKINIGEVLSKKNIIDYEKVKLNLKDVNDDFSEFKNYLLDSLEKQKELNSKKFADLHGQIINLLNVLKEKNFEKFHMDKNVFRKNSH